MARNLAQEPKRPAQALPLGEFECLEQAMHLGYRSGRQAQGLAGPGRWRS